MVDSDVILFPSPERRVVRKKANWEDGDHLKPEGGERLHPRLFLRD
jgi:hypothetical protein